MEKTLNPTTESYTSYTVTDSHDNSTYSSHDWSGYDTRMTMYNEGKIPYKEIYGYAQAIEHAKEVRNHIYNGKFVNWNKTVEIIITTVVKTFIPVDIPDNAMEGYLNDYLRYPGEITSLPETYIDDKDLSEEGKLTFLMTVKEKIKGSTLSIIFPEVREYLALPVETRPTVHTFLKKGAYSNEAKNRILKMVRAASGWPATK